MRVPRRWALVLAAAAVAACVAGLDLRTIAVAALGLAVAAGVPHGASDVRLLAGKAPRAFSLALVTYAAVVGTVALTWAVAPAAWTAAFLAMSVWHFGEGDARMCFGRREPAFAVSRGLALVGIPLLADGAATGPVVAAMAGLEPTGAVVTWMASAWARGLAGLLALQHIVALVAGRDPRGRAALGGEAVLLAALGLTPGLVGFSLYFALWHAPSHMRALGQAAAGAEAARSELVALERAAAGLGVAFVLAGWAWVAARSGAPLPATAPDPEAVGAAFVALAALTVPHVVVVERWQRRLLRGATSLAADHGRPRRPRRG
jgi:Brp/Blh family beta-carotene 15,15'-monooxygenase